MPVLAAFLFAVGLGVAYMAWDTTRQAQTQIATHNRQQANDDGDADSGSSPSTDKPTAEAADTYRVSPDLPRYIRIRKINVDARVRPLGLTKTGAVAAPTNVYDTGWYLGSAKPGEPGATLIDGHVFYGRTNGVFVELNKLVAGDFIEIERGDGQKLLYEVAKTKEFDVDAVDIGSLLVSTVPNKSGLNLITCSGSLNPSTGKYDKRLVVYAAQL